MPFPKTAMVLPPDLMAPAWAAVSIPRARPLTTTTPHSAARLARPWATVLPYIVQLRLPTMAMEGCSARERSPR